MSPRSARSSIHGSSFRLPAATHDRSRSGKPRCRLFRRSRDGTGVASSSCRELKLRYLVIDTGTWLPGKKVVLSTAWISGVAPDDYYRFPSYWL